MNIVTSTGWSVSVSSGGGHGAVLNVRRYPEGTSGRSQAGDLNGTVWPTSDAAFAAALERGYTQVYVQEWCPRCKTQHRRASYNVGPRAKQVIMGVVFKARPGYVQVSRCGYIPMFDNKYWKEECEANILRADAALYERLQRELQTLLDSRNHEAVASVWQRIEDVKNRHGGRVPRKEAA